MNRYFRVLGRALVGRGTTSVGVGDTVMVDAGGKVRVIAKVTQVSWFHELNGPMRLEVTAENWMRRRA